MLNALYSAKYPPSFPCLAAITLITWLYMKNDTEKRTSLTETITTPQYKSISIKVATYAAVAPYTSCLLALVQILSITLNTNVNTIIIMSFT
jgi:hypothetical protein